MWDAAFVVKVEQAVGERENPFAGEDYFELWLVPT
jgi:hypothetical protein